MTFVPKPRVVITSRDIENVRRAAFALLEEELGAEERRRMVSKLKNAANTERIMQDLASTRKLADGYYAWAEYLFKLRDLRKYADLNLRMDEIEGLFALESAEAEFRRTHPACGKCGAMNRVGVMTCRACSGKMELHSAR